MVLAATLSAVPVIPAINLVLALSVDWFKGWRARQPDRQLRRHRGHRRLMAPNYSAQRQAMAKQIGLGRKPAPPPEPENRNAGAKRLPDHQSQFGPNPQPSRSQRLATRFKSQLERPGGANFPELSTKGVAGGGAGRAKAFELCAKAPLPAPSLLCDILRMPVIETCAISAATRPAVDALALRHWGGTLVYDVSGAFETSELPGAIALLDDAFAGAVTWSHEADLLRIVTIASSVEGRGVGRALLRAAEAEARAVGVTRLVVSTGNSNLRALGFYQRNGYALKALHLGAIDGFRRLKPQIPETDPTGIPLRDMIELEKRFD